MANPQQLTSIITIRGNVDSSANAISQFLDNTANRVQALGNYVNQLSAPLIELGKESLSLYADFEDHMLYIQGLGELTKAQMQEIAEAARQAGATTRYTASEAAQALEDNAVAGLNYKDSIALLNSELTAAAAGNLDLSTAASQLLSAMAITGTEVGDAQAFVDKWVKTAASSKSNVEGLGEAVERLGATMSYLSDGETEMFTLFGELGNLGAKGAEMGTWARNILLSLIAPTDKSAEVLDALGYSIEDVEDALSGLDTGESQRLIEKLGLEVYDEDTGKLRNIFDILADLDTALADMTDEERNKAMATIFNKRTLGYAEGLMKVAASGEWRNLFQNIADADGYAEQVANKRESGLGGAMRLLKSQWEEVQLSIGEILTPTAESVFQSLGDLFTSFTSLDEDSKVRVVDTFAALATAGPALLGVGSALRILSFACTPQGAITLATVGIIGLVKAMNDLNDLHFSENFGEIALDMDELGGYVAQLGKDFNSAFEEADGFSQAAADAIEKYAELRSAFGQKIITSALEGNKLTEDDKAQLQSLGEQMIAQINEGILNNYAAAGDAWNVLNSDGALSDDTYVSIIDILSNDFAESQTRLKELGAQLYEALMGDFTPEETRARLKAVLDELDQMASEQAARTAAINNQTLIEKAGWVSQESAKEYFDMLNSEYMQSVSDYNERMATNLATLYVKAQEENTPEAWQTYYDAKNSVDVQRDKLSEPFMQAAQAAMETVFTNSGLGDLYSGMIDVISGNMTMQEFANGLGYDRSAEIKNVIDTMQPMIKMLTGSSYYQQQYAQLKSPEGFWDQFRQGSNTFLDEYLTAESIRASDEWNLNVSEWWKNVKKNLADFVNLQFDESELTPKEIEVFANTDEMKEAIDEETAIKREVPVGGDITLLKDVINQFRTEMADSPIVIPVTTSSITGGTGAGAKGYANGGRADEPSIFGEAGAEWAIPERHTARTADLLRAAAQASGFTWRELIASRGGLNGNAGSTNIVFSPQITAGDTAGLKAALEDAQRRFFAQLKRENMISARVNYAQ